MRLLESLADYDEDIATALKDILSKEFEMDMDERTIRSMVARMSLSDILSIDAAVENKDEETLSELLDKYSTVEYAIPGRTAVTSAASKRAEPAKSATPAQPAASAKPASPATNTTNTAGAKQPVTPIKSSGSQSTTNEELDRVRRLAGLK